MSKRIIDDEFINRIETLSIAMKSKMKGYFGGNHKTNTYGNTVEFADFREYNLGDDLRRIDWNLYSRFEKHFIKLFVDERQMHIQIYLDSSASMFKMNNEKAQFALQTAAALGYLSVNNMDKVSYHVIKEKNCEDISGLITGKNSYYKAVAELEKIKFSDDVNIGESILNSTNIGSNNGLSIIISDFLTEDNWKKAVDYLLYKKREVLLVQVLSDEERNPGLTGRVNLLDVESKHLSDDRNLKIKITKSNLKAYQDALNDYITDIKSFCNKRGVHFLSVNSEETIDKAIIEKLGKVGMIK